jgi:hypothetical protein
MKDLRLMKDHYAACAYRDRENNPGSPWFIDGDSEYVNHRHFIYAVCNDPECGGRLRVASNWLEDQLPSFLGGEQEP